MLHFPNRYQTTLRLKCRCSRYVSFHWSSMFLRTVSVMDIIKVGLSRKHMPIMELGCLLFSTKCGAQSWFTVVDSTTSVECQEGLLTEQAHCIWTDHAHSFKLITFLPFKENKSKKSSTFPDLSFPKKIIHHRESYRYYTYKSFTREFLLYLKKITVQYLSTFTV